jgi:hypothetical protein
VSTAPVVELLWWDGCPSYDDALADLKRILSEEDLSARVELIEIESFEQASSERFPGSPTIRIGGEDIVPPGDGEPFTLTCRIYRLRDGRISPTPDPEDVRAAVRRAKEDT